MHECEKREVDGGEHRRHDGGEEQEVEKRADVRVQLRDKRKVEKRGFETDEMESGEEETGVPTDYYIQPPSPLTKCK